MRHFISLIENINTVKHTVPQDVIDAITTAPFETEVALPLSEISTGDFAVLSVK